MHLPAGNHRVIAEQHLVHDERIDRHQQRQADQDQAAHPDQPVPFRFQEGVAIGVRQPVDHVSEKLEQRHFADGDQHRADRHDEQPRNRRLGIMPAEGEKAFRRKHGFFRRIGIEAGFKPAEHCLAPSEYFEGRRVSSRILYRENFSPEMLPAIAVRLPEFRKRASIS
ncbi:hypothetical protein D3C80_1569660 [compost metagenome]